MPARYDRTLASCYNLMSCAFSLGGENLCAMSNVTTIRIKNESSKLTKAPAQDIVPVCVRVKPRRALDTEGKYCASTPIRSPARG